MATTPIDSQELFSVEQFAHMVPGFEDDHRKVRHLIDKAEANGLARSGALVRIGRRVFINRVGFNRWLETKCGVQEQSV